MNAAAPWTPVRLASTALALSLLCSATEGRTEEAEEPAAERPGEIIITARRRDELLEEAPVPVSVVTGEAVLEKGILQVQGLEQVFPALTVQPTATGNLLFIRGIGNFTLLPNSDPAVAFAYDGVFISRPMGTMSQFFDLDRVELLKGPQGVLYGRNASAGSINLEPRQPALGETSGYAHGSVASDVDLRAETAFNLPLGQRSALRLSGALSRQDPLLDGYTDGQEQQSARAQVKTVVGEKIVVRLSADYNRVGGAGPGASYVGNYVYVPALDRYRFEDSGLALSQGLYAAEAQAYRQTIFLGSAGRTLDAIGSEPEQDHRFYGAHARVDAEFGFAKLTMIPAWRRADIDSIVSSAPFGYRLAERDEQASFEARLSGRLGPFEWLGGTFLFDDRIETDTTTNLSSSLFTARQRYDTFSKALFGNVTLHASRALRLGGGVRWTHDRKSFESAGETLSIICQQRMNNGASCPTVPLFPLVEGFDAIAFPVPQQPGSALPILVAGQPTGAVVRRSASAASGRLVDQAVTWRAGAEADLAENSFIYATVETGYRPGGFNGAVGFETYDPERITAFTLGVRHRGLARRLELDVEAFWWDYRDQQVSSLRPDLSVPPRNANVTDNIARSRIRGIEAEARLRPWLGAQAGATVQYLDADYRSFDYIHANVGVPPLTGCDATLNAASNLYTVDCSTKQPYNSPRWSLTLNARQSLVFGRFVVTAAADKHYRSARNIGFAFLDEQRIGPTWTSSGRLIAETSDGRFEAALFVRNIEGKRFPQFMIYHPVSNALVAITSPPRQWGVRVKTRF